MYAGYSSAFAPNFIRPSDATVRDLEPERSQQIEGGVRVRGRFDEHVLDLDAAAYLIQKRNMLITRGPDDFDQAGLVSSRGFDVSVHYSAPRFIGIDASYALTHARYDEFTAASPVDGETRAWMASAWSSCRGTADSSGSDSLSPSMSASASAGAETASSMPTRRIACPCRTTRCSTCGPGVAPIG